MFTLLVGLLLGILLIVIYQKWTEPDHRSKKKSTRVYQRGGGSAISASSLNTENDTSCSRLRSLNSSVERTRSSDSEQDTVTAGSSYRLSNKGRLDKFEERVPIACDCGNFGRPEKIRDNLDLPANDVDFARNNRVNIFPIKFEKYYPLKLTSSMKEPSALCPDALTAPKPLEPNLLTAFQPSLHAVYFAHHYAFLIKELTESYHFV